MNGLLENTVAEIIKHDENHPDHGIGCTCMDNLAHKIRFYLYEQKLAFFDKHEKSLMNLIVVLSHIIHNQPVRFPTHKND